MLRCAPLGSGLPLPPGAIISMAGRRHPTMTLLRISTSLELAASIHQNSGATSTAAAVILSALLGVTFTPDAGAMVRSSAPMAAGSPTMPAAVQFTGLYIVHSSRRTLRHLLQQLRRLSSALGGMSPRLA
jgi:hypothetical protein